MGLKKCRDCGRDVSTQAKSCPNCGAPPPSSRGTLRAFGLIVMAFLGVALVVAFVAWRQVPQ